MNVPASVGVRRGWWYGNRYLVLRRLCQAGILALFLLGPLAGVWIIKGNLNASLVLGVLPLADPFIAVQSWLADHHLATRVMQGGALITAFYFLVGGRVFCAWVCPLNIVTDAAAWLRRRLGIKGNTRIQREVRYWLLGVVMLLALVTGYMAWEWINPVSVLQRGIIFGMGAGWLLVIAIFLFDLAVSRRGWCGRLCPVGAFYSLLGRYSPLRIRASGREACDKCMDCFEVCPEPQVLNPALFGGEKGIGPVIDEMNCTNCGRCIDVCTREVFRFGSRFNNTAPTADVAVLTPDFKPERIEHEEAMT